MKLDGNKFAQAHERGNGKLCRCDACTATRVRRLSPFDHGTNRAYNIGCRCEKCRGNKSRRDKERYDAQKARAVAGEAHTQ